jgi:hypothetical protein
VSSLNLYVFLQALALAPGVVLALRRAALRGGRSIALAGLLLGLSLMTLAVEFVLQAVILGLALGMLASPHRRGLLRLALAAVLGLSLAGVPVGVLSAMLPETVRGPGFAPDVALANAVHPFSLLQAIVPGLFGSLSSPAEVWWGNRFFSKGLPYFLSFYVGPLVLALAAVGLVRMERHHRLVLLLIAGLALVYALGDSGGLAPLLQRVPLLRSFRYPSKAMLLPHLTIAVLAGLGTDGLRQGRGICLFAVSCAACACAAGALAIPLTLFPEASRTWAGLTPQMFPRAAAGVIDEALATALVALVGVLLAHMVARGALAPTRAAALVALALALDLARADAGINPQVAASYFDAIPELSALRLDRLGGGRVFSYGVDGSPTFRDFMPRAGQRLGLLAFFINRQLLAPYGNLLDQVEAPEGKDLTSFVLRPPELVLDDYDPRRVGAILPKLRAAAVSRILSLDALIHPDLQLLATLPLGLPELVIHVYAVDHAWPRTYVACRAVTVGSMEAAAERPLLSGFDPARDVALLSAAPLSCSKGDVLARQGMPGQEEYEVQADGPFCLVMRDSFARGWHAFSEGHEVPVVRANGKHRAVCLPGGRHRILLRYEPPGLGAGVALMAAGMVGLALCSARPILAEEAL